MQKEKNRNLVFILSVCLTLLICLWGILLPDSFGTAAGNSMCFLTTNFAWLYCLAMTLFVAFCLWIGLFSKYRNIPLGPDGAKPEYSKSAWFYMLFCAGMGVGLVFWGAAEPMNYFAAPIDGLQSGTGEAMRFAFGNNDIQIRNMVIAILQIGDSLFLAQGQYTVFICILFSQADGSYLKIPYFEFQSSNSFLACGNGGLDNFRRTFFNHDLKIKK